MRAISLALLLAACEPQRIAPPEESPDLGRLSDADYGHPIYGIQFYGDDPPAEATIQNGQPMWSVEVEYTTDWARANHQAEHDKLKSIRDKGFQVLLRLDYDRVDTIAPNGDWDARWAYGDVAGQIAATVGDVVDWYIVGNEMTTQSAPEVRDAGWYACVYNGCDGNSVYDRIHANDPVAKVLVGPLSTWPYHIDQIGMDNVDWLSDVMESVDQASDGRPQIDGYALHAYSGPDTAATPPTCPGAR
jgi:hypothetical protein